MTRLSFWIDRGGTFTDCLCFDPETTEIRATKVLSSDRAPLVGIRKLLGLADRAPIPPCEVRMGTTVATNALLERKGAPVGLLITEGFGDLLEIGNQARPSIFALDIVKPQVLYREVLEVKARCDPQGRILSRPDPAKVEAGLKAMRARGIESLAIVVLHAYAGETLELELEAIAIRAGFSQISRSSEVAREIGIVGRGDTTTADAYLTPLIKAYVQTLKRELAGSELRIMQSSGGLIDAESFRGRDAVLSGPAGGVVAYAKIAQREGLLPAIGFDMGGTSTDVSRYAGELERVYESEVAGVRLRAPMMSIHTVAAGGGSICRFDGHRFVVGPESAGAQPGPLAYGHEDATSLAITDINLALGRLRPERFPFPLHETRVQAALTKIAASLAAQGLQRSAEQIAEGFFEVANANMAEAIRKVSVARGYDVRDHTLVVFGGAGGQHACAVARRLGVKKLLFHPHAGVLSAYGMGLADRAWHGAQDAGRLPLSECIERDLAARAEALAQRGRRVLRMDAEVIRRVDLRYLGTQTELTLTLPPEGLSAKGWRELLRERFEAAHERRFGYRRPGRAIEVVAVRVEVREPGAVLSASTKAARPAASGVGTLYAQGRLWRDVPLLERESLTVDQAIEGPALILESTGTIVVDPQWCAQLLPSGCLLLSDRASEDEPSGTRVSAGPADPIQLEIFNNLYMSIAEQMGAVLRNTAFSTNMRERLDFSCAVFDERGGLVANAPHIPVHLGAMSEAVRAVVQVHTDIMPGDVFVTNDPAQGGSHLPDVTVVTPVHDEAGHLQFFCASRGHHADVGGITPGSLPPFSTSLEEEGVVIKPMRAVKAGQLLETELLEVLKGARYPARAPLENLADLEAQIAAGARGVGLLQAMVKRYGASLVGAYMAHVQANAKAIIEDEIERMPDGRYRFEDAMDDGAPICVTLTVTGRRMQVDFSGTSEERDSNLNAPRAVSVAAVLYALRCLVGEPIPLNQGCLEAVDIHVPKGCMLNPSEGRAVCGGNVETSQRVVDVLLGALGQAAASQGTMNNLTFGNADFGYYETICGGAGATPNAPGAHAVHTHMTNTRITDPEVLESRFEVRLREFSVRRGSGGAGKNRGGDGVVREIEFLAPMEVSILSERRARAPFGLQGGGSGQVGVNLHNGTEVQGKTQFSVRAGDRIRLMTPGGGGYGK